MLGWELLGGPDPATPTAYLVAKAASSFSAAYELAENNVDIAAAAAAAPEEVAAVAPEPLHISVLDYASTAAPGLPASEAALFDLLATVSAVFAEAAGQPRKACTVSMCNDHAIILRHISPLASANANITDPRHAVFMLRGPTLC